MTRQQQGSISHNIRQAIIQITTITTSNTLADQHTCIAFLTHVFHGVRAVISSSPYDAISLTLVHLSQVTRCCRGS